MTAFLLIRYTKGARTPEFYGPFVTEGEAVRFGARRRWLKEALEVREMINP